MSDHWSYSQLTTYLKCPLRYFFDYTLALPKRTTPSALALGSAVHEALARYHHALQCGESILPEAVTNTFRQAWEARKQRETIVFQHQSEPEAVGQGIALLEKYLQDPPPRNVVAVEQEVHVPLINSRGEVLAKELVAVLDLVTRDDDGLQITDFKTSSKSYSEYDAHLSLQPTAYLHAAQQHYQESATFQYMVMVKVKQPRIQRLATARMPTDFDRFGDLIEAVDHAVAAGVHYPIESPLNCSTCPHRRPCRNWQSDQTLPAVPQRLPLPVYQGAAHAG